MLPIQTRSAAPTDCAEILAMVRELAAFEKLEQEAVATEGELRLALFGPRPSAEALIALDRNGRTMGFALFFASFSTFLGRAGLYLEDLYVRPEARGAGLGRALLRALAQIAEERHAGRLEWSVLDWNGRAIEFYERLGARPVDGWTRYRMTDASIRALASGPAPS